MNKVKTNFTRNISHKITFQVYNYYYNVLSDEAVVIGKKYEGLFLKKSVRYSDVFVSHTETRRASPAGTFSWCCLTYIMDGNKSCILQEDSLSLLCDC